MAAPAYGLLMAHIPPPNVNDERLVFGVTSTNYAITNDTTFDLDYCETFEGGATQFSRKYLKDCGTGAGEHITLAYTSATVYDEIRVGWGGRIERSQDGGAAGAAGALWDTFVRVQGNATESVEVQFTHHNFGTVPAPNILRKVRIRVNRDSGTYEYSPEFTWTRGSSYTKWEMGIKILSGGLLEVKCYIRDPNQSLIMTATTTVSSAWHFGYMEVGTSTTGEKGVTYTCRFEKQAASWNSGSSGVTLDAQQWLWTWDGTTPLAWTVDLPTADVTNEFVSGTFAVVDDAWGSGTYAHGTDHAFSNSTTARERFLLGWADVTYAANTHLQAVIVNSKSQDASTLAAFLQKRSGLEQVGGTFTPGTISDLSFNMHGVWTLTPQATRWTQTKINETDFGVEKPASGGSTTLYSDAIWRLILSAGTNIEGDPTEDVGGLSPALMKRPRLAATVPTGITVPRTFLGILAQPQPMSVLLMNKMRPYPPPSPLPSWRLHRPYPGLLAAPVVAASNRRRQVHST